MKKIFSYLIITLVMFFQVSPVVFAQPVPASSEPSLTIEAGLSFEQTSVGPSANPTLNIQVFGDNMEQVYQSYVLEVFKNNETELHATGINLYTIVDGSFDGEVIPLATQADATQYTITAKTGTTGEDLLIETIIFQMVRESSPSLSIPSVTITPETGLTTGVSYTVKGSGLFGNATYTIPVQIRAGSELGEVVYSDTYEITTGSGGGFNLTPNSWNPTTFNSNQEEGGYIENIQGAGTNEVATDTFVVQAFLHTTANAVKTSKSFQTNGVTNAINVENGVVTNTDDCIDGQGTYCLLEPIGTGNNLLDRVNINTSFGSYLNGLFQIGLALIGILGVLLIVVGGITYMTTDAIGKKTDGKAQITKALLGIFLALISWLLLQTIDPGLLKFEIGVYQQTVEGGVNTLVSENGSTEMCQALSSAAIAADQNNTSTCNAPGTNNGAVACSWLVDTLIHQVTGSYVGGGSQPELATASLITQLQGNANYQLVGTVKKPLSTRPNEVNALKQASQAGDIIISPTIPNNTGHVGICTSNDCSSIVSNSSQQQAAASNFTYATWTQSYNGNDLHIFRHTSCIDG